MECFLSDRRPIDVLFAAVVALLLTGCGAQRPQTEPSGGELTALPLRDRQPDAVAEVSSELRDATTADSAESGANGPVGPASGLSSAGLPTTQNAALVDGLSAWQSFRSGPRGSTASGVRSGATYGEAAIRNLRVAPQSFSAESPAAGAVTSVETRAGETGKPHGAFVGLLRESAWAATNPFSVVTRYNRGSPTDTLVKPEDSLGQLAGRVGFAVPRARHVQAFAAYEAQLRTDPIVSTPAYADFFRLTAMQSDLLGNRGVTTAQTGAALNYLDSLMGQVNRSSSRGLLFARIDAQPGRRDHLSVGYTRNRFDSPAGSGFTSTAASTMARGRGSVGDELLRIDAVQAASQHLFSPRFMADTRFQFARDFESESPRTPLPQEPAISAGGFAPEVSIAPNGFVYGTLNTLGKAASPDERRMQWIETVAFHTHRTQVTAGVDWSRITDFVATQTNTAGTFHYDSGTTGGRAGGLVDWITDYTYGVNAYPNGGCPSITATTHKFCFESYTQTFGGSSTAWTTHDLAAFAQSTTELARNLSLTLGVRWEYTLLPIPPAPNLSLDQSLRGISAPGLTSQFPEDRNNFGPRAGVSWIRKGVAVQVGYGLFFGRLPGATVLAAITDTATTSSARSIRITPSTETPCPQVPTIGFGFPCAYTSAPPAAVGATTSAVVFARDFRLPAVQRFTLALDRSLSRRWSGHMMYAGAIATQLPTSVDVNIAPSTTSRTFSLQGGDGRQGSASGTEFALPFYTARRINGYGPISALRSSANATYHAGTAQVRYSGKRASLTAEYTFSHAIDYNPRLSATPSTMTQLDPYNAGYDKGRASLDFPQRFAGTLVSVTALGRGPVWLRAAASGIRLAAIGSTTSGAPYGYQVYGGTELTGGEESLNGAGGATYLPTVGRNTLRLPARGRADLRVSRPVKLPRSMTLDPALEVFNLLNNNSVTRVETRAFSVGDAANVGDPTPLVFNGTATSEVPAFGTPLSSTSGLSRERLLEVSVHLSF